MNLLRIHILAGTHVDQTHRQIQLPAKTGTEILDQIREKARKKDKRR